MRVAPRPAAALAPQKTPRCRRIAHGQISAGGKHNRLKQNSLPDYPPLSSFGRFTVTVLEKNICAMNSMSSSLCLAPPPSPHAILKSERAPRSPRSGPMEKRCATFHRQRLGLKNPAAGDTGLPEPLQGLPDDSIEIARTVAVGTGSCQSLGKEAIGKSGVSPETAAPSVSDYPARLPIVAEGSREVTVFPLPKRHLLYKKAQSY